MDSGMTPYYQDHLTTIYCGDSLEIGPQLEANSIDGIISDPPYGLEFMGKEWDHGIPGAPFWQGFHTPLKPGAFIFAFGGSRTYHRLACAVEDAGYEIRDSIRYFYDAKPHIETFLQSLNESQLKMYLDLYHPADELSWVYGCLSEDTEYLTKNGWEHYHKTTNDGIIIDKEILVYDIQNDVYKWEKPERWYEYNIEQDTAFRIQSDNTDQIVSRNHRCLVERSGKLVFVQADELKGVEAMPTLPSDFFTLPQVKEQVLWKSVQRVLSGARLEKMGKNRFGNFQQAREQEAEGELWAKEPVMEGGSNLLQTEGEIRQPVNQVCEMSTGVYNDGSQGWLRNGTSVDSSKSDWKASDKKGMCSPHQSRRNGQQDRESDVIFEQRRTQEIRTRAKYQTTLASVSQIKYTGLMWCPTVSTGAFVARRNGRIFITGNSGFPKSANISKNIDKAAGVEREVVGKRVKLQSYGADVNNVYGDGPDKNNIQEITAPATEAAKLWDGFGTALKPAYENILVAMAPLDGTYAQNALKYGVAGLNIDAGRVGFSDSEPDSRVSINDSQKGASGNPFSSGNNNGSVTTYKPQGRWPANIILTYPEDEFIMKPNLTQGQKNELYQWLQENT